MGFEPSWVEHAFRRAVESSPLELSSRGALQGDEGSAVCPQVNEFPLRANSRSSTALGMTIQGVRFNARLKACSTRRGKRANFKGTPPNFQTTPACMISPI